MAFGPKRVLKGQIFGLKKGLGQKYRVNPSNATRASTDLWGRKQPKIVENAKFQGQMEMYRMYKPFLPAYGCICAACKIFNGFCTVVEFKILALFRYALQSNPTLRLSLPHPLNFDFKIFLEEPYISRCPMDFQTFQRP